MHPKLPDGSLRRLALMGAIPPILPLYTISLGPLYHKILRPPLSCSSKLLYQPNWILASLFFIDLDFDSVPYSAKDHTANTIQGSKPSKTIQYTTGTLLHYIFWTAFSFPVFYVSLETVVTNSWFFRNQPSNLFYFFQKTELLEHS